MQNLSSLEFAKCPKASRRIEAFGGYCRLILILLAFQVGWIRAALGQNITGAESTAPGLGFSSQPTADEIRNARVFDEPLIPLGGEPSSVENAALAKALVAYSSRTNTDDFTSLTSFLDAFPNSEWRGSLLLHFGVEYYNFGYYSRALNAWEQAWKECEAIQNGPGKVQADRALGELARMYSKLGRMHELGELLNSTTNRSLTGPSTQLIHSAQQALWMMQNRPGISFKCGPFALDSILSDTAPKNAANPLVIQFQSSTNGISLSQVAQLSAKLGMNYQMAFRSPGAPWVVPSVLHWKLGHYAAVLRRDGNRFLVEDHTFQSSAWISSSALEQESSGYFLIPPGSLPKGWRTVSEAESQNIWGKGTVTGQDGTQTGAGPNVTQSGGSPNAGTDPGDDPGNGDGNGAAGDPSGSGDPDSSPPGSCSAGMTTYTIDTMLASLTLNDTPVGYKPPVGPWVKFTASYNQDEASQPATFSYSNLGQKWTCNWIAYITDNPSSVGADITYYQPGGGTLTFTGFNYTTQSYATEPMTQAILVRTSSSTYEMQFRSGAKKEFAASNGATGSTRLIFLTQIIDPSGNSVTLSYDSSLRITNITDAIGQVTVLNYTNVNYPDAITSVTDPFGRTARFQYNSSGLLAQITDVLGLQSQYVYGPNDFITNLVTPYGTTVFTNGTINGGPWLQATDPLGESELAAAPLNGIGTVSSDPAATLPTNMPVAPYNVYLEYRDTFFWNKNAYEQGAWNPSFAKVYHFCHVGVSSIEGGVLESTKEPLENRVWFNYPNQPQGNVFEPQSIDRPSAIGRVLDNGTTQLRLFQYNELGHVTNSTDPTGRNFTYVYSTNNVDLLQVLMTHNGQNQLMSSITYNSQHKPLTITDASGQTTTNTYNARGQILTTSDPLGETTTFSYNTNGYLLSITGPLQTTNDVTSFTYDDFGRVRTTTDTEGYTLIYAYDAMNRITSITHPDGTYEQFVYNLLDLAATRDRLGRWTTNIYNADRQLVQTKDPLGRVTRYEWCQCGALTGLIDPMGRQTTWKYDIQSRPIAKSYVNGLTISYVYENTTSRLNSRIDEQGQQTVYKYNVDDTLATIFYPNAVHSTPTVTYTYDRDYNRIQTMQDGIGFTVYAYNQITPTPALGAGQLASVSGPLPNSTVTYVYDPLGRVVGRDINGVSETTSYDILGRPTSVANALGSFKYGYVDATARLASEAYPNGQTNLYSYYNNLGDQRLLQIQHLYPNGSLLSAFGYSYSPMGRITSWTNQWDALPTSVWLPSYDAADQLTNIVCLGGSQTTNYAYAYDFAGNRTLGQSNTIQNLLNYNALNQIVGAIPGFTNSATYEWDAENRLAAINQGSNRSEFSYDGLGRRVESVEKTNGVVQNSNYYLWCGTEVCEIRDADGGTVLRRVFPQGEALAGTTGSTNYLYTRDHLGSVREAIGANGGLATRYVYDAYGQKTVIQETFQTTFGFAGNFVHQKTGLYLTWFRALDCSIGRWLSRDPIAERGGVNLYAYVRNDPLNYFDPYGLDTTTTSGCSGNADNSNPVPPGLSDVVAASASGQSDAVGYGEVGDVAGYAGLAYGAYQTYNNKVNELKNDANTIAGGAPFYDPNQTITTTTVTHNGTTTTTTVTQNPDGTTTVTTQNEGDGNRRKQVPWDSSQMNQ